MQDTVDLQALWREAARIRATELLLLELFGENALSGTVHTAVGQELCAAALQAHLRPGTDAFFGSHRSHGHLLAHGAPADALLAELMGRDGALCAGRGGSQNLHYRRFFSSGVQGGAPLLATGYAWSQKLRSEPGITVTQIGDGTLGEGGLYEALTFAAVLELPLLFFLEWNGTAQSTDVSLTTPGDIAARFAGFGLRVRRADDRRLGELHALLGEVVAEIRAERKPQVVIVRTRRLLAHSKGDDVRAPEELQRLREEDPLSQELARPAAREGFATLRVELRGVADEVARRPLVGAGGIEALPVRTGELDSLAFHSDLGPGGFDKIVSELNQGLHALMTERADVLVLGEDVADPYGGAFKVTRGLSTAFPGRVFSTPVAEAGIVGLANGAALAGLRPVAEIMFSDFATLAADQLVNHAAKLHATYGGAVTCPVTVRLVSGAGRGYGPTHSQSLETLFLGVPGLRVLALSHRHRPDRLLREAVIGGEAPTVLVEHKLLYPRRPATARPLDLVPVRLAAAGGDVPHLGYTPPTGIRPQVTLVTYGGTAPACEEAMEELFVEEELTFDYFIVTQLWPLRGLDEVARSARRTGRLVVVEEGCSQFGLGAAVVAEVACAAPGARAAMVGSRAVPIPCARHLEDTVIPGARDVIDAVLRMVKES
jgi:2-oxoisovalerate dehydrogenase E1 component